MEDGKFKSPWHLPENHGPTEPASERRLKLEQKVTAQLTRLEAMITAHSEANSNRKPVKKTLGPKAEEVIRQRLQSYQDRYAAAHKITDDEEAVEQLNFLYYYLEGDILFLNSALDYIY